MPFPASRPVHILSLLFGDFFHALIATLAVLLLDFLGDRSPSHPFFF